MNKFSFKIISFFLLISLNFNLYAKNERYISYQEAIQIALKNNPKAKSTSYQIHSARAELSRLKGSELPKINFGFNAALSDNPMDVFGYKLSQGNVTFNDFGLQQYQGPGSINVAPKNLNSPGYYNNFNKGFRLSVPIYAGGAFIARKNAALSNIIAKKNQANSIKNQLGYEVIQSYFGSIAAQKLIAISKENLNKSIYYKKLSEQLHQQAQALNSDVLLANAYIRASENNLLNNQTQYLNQLDTLNTLLVQKKTMKPFGHLSIQQPNIKENQLLKLILINNPQLKDLNQQLQTLKQKIKVIKAKTLPQINLNMHHDWNGERLTSGLPNNMIALNLDWELLNNAERGPEIQKIYAKYSETALLLDDMRNQMHLLLNQALRTRENAMTQKATFEKNIHEIKIANKQLTKRFGRGLAPLGMVLDSQIRLVEAENQKIQAEYNFVMANAQILMLTNKIICPN